MKLNVRFLSLAVGVSIFLAGCAANRPPQQGETMPTESIPKGVASALFPDPAWK